MAIVANCSTWDAAIGLSPNNTSTASGSWRRRRRCSWTSRSGENLAAPTVSAPGRHSLREGFRHRRGGFIGSNLADRLLATATPSSATTTSRPASDRFLDDAPADPTASRSCEGDMLDLAAPDRRRCAGCDFVFHLAANADVRFGTEHPRTDLEQNTIATFNVLEAMRAQRRPADRVLLDRLDLRRAGRLPDARRTRRSRSRPRCTAPRSSPAKA